MKHQDIDIVVPVWNKPEETRQCLTALVETAPGARLILLDNASERETESLLQEFADGLGDRALLFRNDKIQDFVPVVNKGLAKADAPVVIVIRNTTTVGKGWLEPMLKLLSERTDIGLVIPNLVNRKGGMPSTRAASCGRTVEVAHAYFDAVLIVGDLYRRIGGFDEGMDGGLWCLKDYTRRALSEGFTSLRVTGPPVFREENLLFGSQARREEKVRKSIERYESLWGQDQSFFVELSADADPGDLERQFGIFLDGARCGFSFTVVVRPGIYRKILKKGYHCLHENIIVERLPYLFSAGSAEKRFSRMCADNPELKKLSNADQLSSLLRRDGGKSPSRAKDSLGGTYAA